MNDDPLSPMNARGRELLARYREDEAMPADARARIVSGLGAHLGPLPGSPPGASALPRALATKSVAGTMAKIVAAAAVAAVAGLGAHRLSASPPDAPLKAPASVPAPSPTASPARNDAVGAAAQQSTTRMATSHPAVIPGEPGGPKGAEVVAREEPEPRGIARSPAASAEHRGAGTGDHAASAAQTGGGTAQRGGELAPVPLVLAEDDTPEPPSSAARAPDAIAEELALLQRAQAALQAGRPSDALADLSEHARRFPHGKLAESREVARIVALCNAGNRSASRAAAERFLAARPGSPFASRVRAVCVTE